MFEKVYRPERAVSGEGNSVKAKLLQNFRKKNFSPISKKF